MPIKKCFFRCKPKGKILYFYGFPKDQSTRQKWLDTLNPGQQQKDVWVCQRHFLPDCFWNLGQYKAELAPRPLLNADSVPTILGRLDESQALDNTTRQSLSGATCRDIECQTFIDTRSSVTQTLLRNVGTSSVGTSMRSRSTKTVATQLSLATLQNHVRSKGSQATVSYQKVGTQTFVQEKGQECSSTSVTGLASSSLGVRAAKRACLELLEKSEGEEEDEEEEEDDDDDEEKEREDTLVSQPHESTWCAPVDALTEPSEMSGMDSTTDYDEPKFIVNESTWCVPVDALTEPSEMSGMDSTTDYDESKFIVNKSTWCVPVDALTEPSEMSGMDSTTDYDEPKFSVSESFLTELFQTCPVCKWGCEVQRQRLGTCVTLTQLCPKCLYTKEWQSQPMRGNTPVGNL